MTILELKEFLSINMRVCNIKVIDLFGDKFDRKYKNSREFIEDEEIDNLKLINKEAIEIYDFDEITIEIFIDTREEE